MQITDVEPNLLLLNQVKELGRKNRKTLGFLPDEAFHNYAEGQTLLAAVDDDGSLLGYVIYRVARQRAAIVHLCVNQAFRKQHVARLLFEAVVNRTKDWRGILVRSRKDYPSNGMWGHFGFGLLDEIPGRGKKGTILDVWWYEHPHTNLFSSLLSPVGHIPVIDAVIDQNIFYDVHYPNRPHSDEANALRADWLQDEVRLCVTPELFNEIGRNSDAKERKRQRGFASQYHRLSGTYESQQRAKSILGDLWGQRKGTRHDSDLMHLVHTYAAGARYFITRDEAIQKRATQIQELLGVEVLSPSAFIVQLDSLRDADSYQPIRVKGSKIVQARVQADDISGLLEIFPRKSLRESRAEFRDVLAKFLAQPDISQDYLIRESGVSILLFVLLHRRDGIVEVPILRSVESSITGTIVRQIIAGILDNTAKNKYSVLYVSDACVSSEVENAFWEGGFFKASTGWIKPFVDVVGNRVEIASHWQETMKVLMSAQVATPEVSAITEAFGQDLSLEICSEIEHRLWPLKLLGQGIPNVIIPVKPVWAQHLFDEGLAKQTLFGARQDLMLSWENVYYRSPRKVDGLVAGARILWYISKGSGYVGAGSIRASSTVEEVLILPAKEAFTRFRRLGIYEWADVKGISNKDSDSRVMVIRFANTENFADPVSLADVQRAVQVTERRRISIQGPFRISDSAFAQIYCQGRQKGQA